MSVDREITVCAACLTASCWHGEFMCRVSRTANIKKMRVSELVKLDLEHPDNWSAEKLGAIYGTAEEER